MMLDVKNLSVKFNLKNKTIHALQDISYNINNNECLCIVGESGSGKSVNALALMQLLSSNSTIEGQINFNGKNLLEYNAKQMQQIRNKEIAMIFQDPLSSLNPSLTIGYQICESFNLNKKYSHKQAMQKAQEILETCHISQAKKRLKQYPFEFSGGMLQRVIIALSIANNAKLLICDEVTTALDASIQKQILALLKNLQQERNLSLLFITHDLGVVASMADRVLVMYSGNILEQGTRTQILNESKHPYTLGLKQSLPFYNQGQEFLKVAEGNCESLTTINSSCSYLNRCPYAMNICQEKPPFFNINKEHETACYLYHQDAKEQQQLFQEDASCF